MNPALFQQPFFQVTLPIIATFAIAIWVNNRALDGINRRLDDIVRRLDAIEARLARIEERLAEHGERIARLEVSPLRGRG